MSLKLYTLKLQFELKLINKIIRKLNNQLFSIFWPIKARKYIKSLVFAIKYPTYKLKSSQFEILFNSNHLFEKQLNLLFFITKTAIRSDYIKNPFIKLCVKLMLKTNYL